MLTGKVRADVYINVQLDGRKVSVLLDSGCETSVINNRFVQPGSLQPTTLELFTANGEKLPIMGEVNVDMLIGQSKLRHKMVASSAIAEVILGIDFLKEFKCRWDFEHGVININGQWIKLHSRGTRGAVRRI